MLTPFFLQSPIPAQYPQYLVGMLVPFLQTERLFLFPDASTLDLSVIEFCFNPPSTFFMW